VVFDSYWVGVGQTDGGGEKEIWGAGSMRGEPVDCNFGCVLENGSLITVLSVVPFASCRRLVSR
jgi:hypothetical protein